jgi:hypothetical protein
MFSSKASSVGVAQHPAHGIGDCPELIQGQVRKGISNRSIHDPTQLVVGSLDLFSAPHSSQSESATINRWLNEEPLKGNQKVT